jgi:hypothetical protein
MANYMMGAGVNNEVKEILEGIVEKLRLGWPVNPAPLVCDTLNFAAKEIQQITLSSGCFAGNHTKYDNMDLLSEYGFVSPLEFSKEVIEWAANADDIPQGYPDDLNGAMKYVADRYQWGLFNKF